MCNFELPKNVMFYGSINQTIPDIQDVNVVSFFVGGVLFFLTLLAHLDACFTNHRPDVSLRRASLGFGPLVEK